VDQITTLKRLAVFGSPIKHSLSPRIHQLFAEQAGIAVDYQRIEVNEEFLSREVQKLAEAGGAGCNITLPVKQRAFKLANKASERAELAQAANTLVFDTRTRWSAHSTDGPGLVSDLTVNLSMDLHGRRICVVGAGGAAAGILYDLLMLEPAGLTIFNRTFERAELLAERFSQVGQITAAGLEGMDSAEPFDLVINATSAGHFRSQPVLSAGLFGHGSRCYDLSYGKAHESLNQWCIENDIRCHDGLGMLVEQAAESFYLWTRFRPDTAPVLESLRANASGTR